MNSALASIPYLGFFLIGFALYASVVTTEGGKKSTLVMPVVVEPNKKEVAAGEVIGSFKAPAARLQALYQMLKGDDLFSKKVDGLSLEFKESSVLMVMSSDELFETGEISLRQNWIHILDRVAERLKPEQAQGLKIKVHGYADQNNPQDVRENEWGASDFALSSERAEWVARYLEREHGFRVKGRVQLVVHGGEVRGKRLDVELCY